MKKNITSPMATVTTIRDNKNVLDKINAHLHKKLTISEIQDMIDKKLANKSQAQIDRLLPANLALLLMKDKKIILDMNGLLYDEEKISDILNPSYMLDINLLRQAETNLNISVRNTYSNNLNLIREVAILEIVSLIKSISDIEFQYLKTIGEKVHYILVNDYHMNDQNGYVYIEDGQISEFIVEADNNATVSIDIDKLNATHTIPDMLNVIAKEVSNFSADDTFEELWSTSFGEHNDFKAIQFLNMLIEDEKQFKNLVINIFKNLD